MTRVVMLPKEISDRLDNLTQLNEEINGVLFYRQNGNYCPIEASYITGIGDEGNVGTLPEKLAVVNEFLERNKDYQYVQFHTHTMETIRKYGDHYATNFSELDDEGILENLNDDKRYIAMLVTPETKILEGIDDPQLRIVDDFNGYAQRTKAVSIALDKISENLGYGLNDLRATR